MKYSPMKVVTSWATRPNRPSRRYPSRVQSSWLRWMHPGSGITRTIASVEPHHWFHENKMKSDKSALLLFCMRSVAPSKRFDADALCRLATGRHLVVICDICHHIKTCFIVCCLSFRNASFFLNGFLDAVQLLFSGASYVICIKWWPGWWYTYPSEKY